MSARVVIKTPTQQLESCFGQCLLQHLFPTGPNLSSQVPFGKVKLTFNQEKFELVLSPTTTEQQQKHDDREGVVVWLAHKHPLCPARAFQQSGNTRLDHRLRVGVAVVLQSRDGKVLLTQRQHRLRSFPGLFVLPGGNLDAAESLIDAGKRELSEETGLQLSEDADARVLCMWESTFPLSFEREKGESGLTHHHLVVYVVVNEPHLHSSDLERFTPQVSEVRQLVWLSHDEVRQVIGELGESPENRDAMRVRTFRTSDEAFDAQVWNKQVPIDNALNGFISLEELSDRVVIGTRFALRCLLNPTQGNCHL